MVTIASVLAGFMVLAKNTPSRNLPADVWLSILLLSALGSSVACIGYYALTAIAGSV